MYKPPLIVIVVHKSCQVNRQYGLRNSKYVVIFDPPAYKSGDTGHAQWTFWPLTWVNATLKLYTSITVQDRPIDGEALASLEAL